MLPLILTSVVKRVLILTLLCMQMLQLLVKLVMMLLDMQLLVIRTLVLV
ncbi:protein of unknown function [Latilactobacillus sakei]|nr:protein of unknown function [Latilactobacillus sakei]